MSPLVVTETRRALEERRAQLLRELGVSLEEFRAIAASRTLTAEEWATQEELDEISFLLGEK